MNLEGEVVAAKVEERDLVGKDGVKSHSKISHVVLSVKKPDGVEILNVRAYDATWELPKPGTKWQTPAVRRYECFDGMVAEVSVAG